MFLLRHFFFSHAFVLDKVDLNSYRFSANQGITLFSLQTSIVYAADRMLLRAFALTNDLVNDSTNEQNSIPGDKSKTRINIKIRVRQKVRR